MPKASSSVQAKYLNRSKEQRLELETVPGLALQFLRRSIIITLYKKRSSVRVHNMLKSSMARLLYTRTHSSRSYLHKTYPRSSQLKIPAWNKAGLPRLHSYLGSWTGLVLAGVIGCSVLFYFVKLTQTKVTWCKGT